MNQEIKQCQNCKKDFTIEPEDFVFYEKIKVPPPTFCPDCRTQRRMMFRNERALYKRRCDVPTHNEEMLTIYSPDKKLKTFDQKYWWSDNWDSLDYGREYDFSKPFFQQFKELRDHFPLQALSNSNAINSEFCNVADQSKDCYLISAAEWNEGVIYGNRVSHDKDSIDLYYTNKSELCYEDIACKDSYRLFFSIKSQNCIDSYFLYDCRNCQNCFCCSGLRNKQFYVYNKPYSKEEYLTKIKEFDLGSFNKILKFKEEFRKLYEKSMHKYATLLKSLNSAGDNIDNAKNCFYCFDVLEGAEDCKYINWGGYILKDSYDGGPGVGAGGEMLYEVFDTGLQGSKLFFTSVVYGSQNVNYAFNCYNCSNLFGCIGLRKKQYCILNKQYTPESYRETAERIKEQMNTMPYIDSKGRIYKYGEFFPPELSPFSYNETVAQEYFPLTKEQAISQGYRWKEKEERNIQITMTNDQIPDHIKDVPDSIVNEIIQCSHAIPRESASNNSSNPRSSASTCNEQCTEAFKIIQSELDFYRKMNLPLPRLCPNCRHYQRIKQRNPLKLWKRKCQCNGSKSSNGTYKNTIEHFHGDQPCPNEFETTYSPDRPEIVYCEACYNAEVV